MLAHEMNSAFGNHRSRGSRFVQAFFSAFGDIPELPAPADFDQPFLR
jgi:hypothetical protein